MVDRTGWKRGGPKTDIRYKDGFREGLSTAWGKNGQKSHESTYKNGKRDGLATRWYSDGQKEYERNYKDGKTWSAVVWKPNGEKCPVTNILNGNGVIVWYGEDGAEYERTTFKNGEAVQD